ncbi:MAG: hypothetical protein PHI85_06815 [Victivallaceae bacterium]|nr:hypothetical protein [Victivallaceae bacterium]
MRNRGLMLTIALLLICGGCAMMKEDEEAAAKRREKRAAAEAEEATPPDPALTGGLNSEEQKYIDAWNKDSEQSKKKSRQRVFGF